MKSDYFERIEALQTELFANNGEMPRAFLQWKGTDACMDFHCKCGAHLHFDDDFLYAVLCSHCDRVYALGDRVPVFDMTGTAHDADLRKIAKVGEAS